jgi:hypothetical protein
MLKLASNLNLLPLHAAILRQSMLWGLGSSLDSIVLKGPHHETGKIVSYPAMDMIWQARPHVFGLMASMEGEELGDVEIRRVPAGSSFGLESEKDWQTYLFVLACGGGVMLGQQMLQPGEAWAVEGEVIANNSADTAYFMLCSIRSAAPCTYMPPVVENGNISA